MTDAEFVAALQRIFDANDPSDGIDRSSGFGTDYRVTALRVVGSDDGFDDLEITMRIGPQTVMSRLLFDRAWRETSGLDDVGAYAIFVAERWRFSEVAITADTADAEPADTADAELWQFLLASLAASAASVAASRLGLIEIVDDEGDRVTMHVTPAQWRRFAAGRHEAAFEQLDELIGSRWDDEEHIVFFRGGFHHSVREQVPPVRSKMLF